jgi:heat-inducible transcriptional repressor
MMEAGLNHKHERVLEAVITSYIRNGRPVGSSSLCRGGSIGLSPASIRSVMADLETAGLLAKPHVSAGRVPTEAGYRLYVDRFVRPGGLTRKETTAIRSVLCGSLSVGEALERVVRLLESLSHVATVALMPALEVGRIMKMETTRVADDTLLAVLAAEPGSVRTLSMRFPDHMALRRASARMAEFARMAVGRTPGEAIKLLARRGHTEKGGGPAAFGRAISRLVAPCGRDTYVLGLGNIVGEMSDVADAKSLLKVIESKQAIAGALLADTARPGVRVTIGSENRFEPMRRCSVVSSSYWVGGARGVIGLIGPLRMEYPRLITLVDLSSRELTNHLNKPGGRGQSAN